MYGTILGPKLRLLLTHSLVQEAISIPKPSTDLINDGSAKENEQLAAHIYISIEEAGHPVH